jgi:PKD repeat protein
MKSKVVLLMLLLMFSATLPAIRNARAGDASSAWISVLPGIYVPTHVDETFTVNVNIANVSNLQGFEFKLGYSTSNLEALEVAEGPFMKGFGTTLPFKLEINGTAGYVWVVVVIMGAAPAQGDGILASITFKCTSVGECLFDLYDTTLMDPEALPIDHHVADGYSGDEFVDPPSIHILDTMDSGWAFSSWAGLDGYVDYGYSSDTYTSAPESIFTHIWGWGTRGEDYSGIYVNKTFAWQPTMALTSLKLNYLIAQMTDGDGWGGMAALTWVKVITHDASGAHEYAYIVAGGTTDVGGWSYNYLADRGPNVKYINWMNQEIPPPGHGEIEPPLNVWYTLDRNVDADFNVDWSTVTQIEVALELSGGYLHLDHFQVYFDDLGLGGGPTPPHGPTAAFTITPSTADVGDSVEFDASQSSQGYDGTDVIPITEYRWNFGDGYSTTTSSPITYHSFGSRGTFYVSLTVFAPGATPDTDATAHTISIGPVAPPHADFSWLPSYPWINEAATFNASSSTPGGRPIVSYEWDFGDGGQSSGIVVTHTYTTPGIRTVMLTVTDSGGVWDIKQKPIRVISLHCDFNFDGVVDDTDLQLLALVYGSSGPPGWIPQDLNRDGRVGLADLVAFANCPNLQDTLPPITQISLAGTLGTNGWYRSDVTGTLTATDQGLRRSGVDRTEYCFDGITWVTYTQPFDITTEGTTTVYYRSIDKEGNVEQTKSQTIKIDKTPPNLTVTSPEARNYFNTETLAINYAATDALSGLAVVNATLGYDPAVAYVSPQVTNVMVGDTFSVDVNVADVADLAGIELLLRWDNTLVEYISHSTTMPVEAYPGGILHGPILVALNESSQSQEIGRAHV